MWHYYSRGESGPSPPDRVSDLSSSSFFLSASSAFCASSQLFPHAMFEIRYLVWIPRRDVSDVEF